MDFVVNLYFFFDSDSYAQDQVFLMWNPKQKVFLDELSDPNYSFQISTVEPGEELYDLFTTSQASCCNREFQMIIQEHNDI